MSTDDRLRLHPNERLAAPVQLIDLPDAIRELWAELHEPTEGRRQVALVKRGPVSVILFAFERDGFLKEHQTEGEVTIHVLRGRLAVTVGSEVTELGTGTVVSLAPGVAHAVRALESSEMLLTVCRVVTGEPAT